VTTINAAVGRAFGRRLHTVIDRRLVAVHEAGHVVVARSLGYRIASASMWEAQCGYSGRVEIDGHFRSAPHQRASPVGRRQGRRVGGSLEDDGRDSIFGIDLGRRDVDAAALLQGGDDGGADQVVARPQAVAVFRD
jgi:hypothetical protein